MAKVIPQLQYLSTRVFYIFRKRCDELFTCLHQQDVPLLIFSAGIGNVIEEAIKHQAHMHDNMHIVSNFMNFSEEVGHLDIAFAHYFL